MARTAWRRFDLVLLALAVMLAGFGVLMIASAVAGNKNLEDYPLRQALFLAIGIVLMLAAASLDYRLLSAITTPIYVALLGFLLVIAAIGTSSGGAQRWLAFGDLFLQPSELVKLAVILVLAQYLSNHEERMGMILVPVGAVCILLPAVGLIYLQPNLGTALSVLMIGGMMLVIAGLRIHHMVILVAAAAAAAVPVWQFLLEDYMRNRILTFFRPDAAAVIDTYNIDQALISIGSGGWLGRGLFRGSQSQLHFLRVRHTDFIFSVTAEELGFVGAIILLALLGLLMLRLVRVAGQARDTYGRLIVTGVTTMILYQTLVNVGMNLNMMPVSGMPLPLVSYGGSSLWSYAHRPRTGRERSYAARDGSSSIRLETDE